MLIKVRDIFRYIQSDYIRYEVKPTLINILISALTARNHCFAYSFWLRLASRKNLVYPLARFMHHRLSRKYGIQISPSTKIGFGLKIIHGIGIIINARTIIGNNCNISHFLSIGSNNGTPAIIGDCVYIGPHVCVVENVHIGNNVTIGAGSVVTKDIPENATVAGVPAKIVSYKTAARFIQSKWDPNV